MAFSEASFIQCSFHWTDRLAGSPRHCTMLFADLISQYIHLDSKLVATLALVYLIPSWLVWVKIKCMVHVALPKLPKSQFNQFSKADNRH